MNSPQNHRMKRLQCLFDQRVQKLMTERMLTELTKVIAQNVIVRTLRCFGMVVAQKVTDRKCYFAVV